MSVFMRRFSSDPGNDVLLEIESVNILDLDPPAPIIGIGAGTVICVGELENGSFNTPTEVTSTEDLSQNFGTLGYTYAGSVGQNPCARTRSADGALVGERWNGNAFVQLNGKKFKRLILVRVDTSVGTVSFTAVPYMTGALGPTFDLEPGQILALNVGAGDVSATFTGTAATVTAVGGTYATTFAGGETLTVGYDDVAAVPNFTVTFLAADQTAAQVRDRINQYAGFSFVDLSGGQLRFTGRQRGTGGKVRIVSGSTGVLTQLGLTAATTSGTGNTANIDAVTVAEVNTVVSGTVGLTAVTAQQDSSGALRVSTTSASLVVGAATTATALGFVAAQAGAILPVSGVLPAGTLVQNAGATAKFVTMQDVVVTAATAGPYSVKVRHATDDGTGTSATAGTIVSLPNAPDVGAFTATNPSLLTACLTESQIDAAYQTALDSTLDLSSVAREANVIWSARHSNAVRRAVKKNAKDASEGGMFGRVCCVRAPMGTTKAAAQGDAEPGVGAYRDQRVIYCWPQASTQVPLIARVGTAGGTGFTATGIVDVGADGFMASVLSQLNPEENPGQETDFMDGVIALESSANARNLSITDYKNFKAKGIAALRIDEGKAVFQSGVTAVDPLVNSALASIKRRRMADFIQDSLAARREEVREEAQHARAPEGDYRGHPHLPPRTAGAER